MLSRSSIICPVQWWCTGPHCFCLWPTADCTQGRQLVSPVNWLRSFGWSEDVLVVNFIVQDCEDHSDYVSLTSQFPRSSAIRPGQWCSDRTANAVILAYWLSTHTDHWQVNATDCPLTHTPWLIPSIAGQPLSNMEWRAMRTNDPSTERQSCRNSCVHSGKHSLLMEGLDTLV